MKIKFTHDFRGKLTDEHFYLAGDEIEVSNDIGQQLIDLDHAVAVEVEPEPEAPKVVVSKPQAEKPKRGRPKKEADDGAK